MSVAGGGEAFAGQRDDPFFGDVGAIFDLVAIRKGTGNMGGGKDFFAGYGVHTFGVQVPIAGLNAKNSTIGVWSSVDRRKVTTSRHGHAELGRLGPGRPPRQPAGQRGRHPDRDSRTSGTRSSRRRKGRFEKYYTTPILAAVINKLYKLGAPETGRDDLVAVLLTGVPKLNFTGTEARRTCSASTSRSR